MTYIFTSLRTLLLQLNKQHIFFTNERQDFTGQCNNNERVIFPCQKKKKTEMEAVLVTSLELISLDNFNSVTSFLLQWPMPLLVIQDIYSYNQSYSL